MSEAIERIQSAIRSNKIQVFMKGTRSFPQCGFSARSHPEVRDEVKRYSNWPTIPQVYIDGKFIGGCDIIRELYESGELQTLVKAAVGQGAQQ